MEIKILGTGCAGCKLVHQRAQEAVAEMGIEATVVKEEDLMKIMEYNVMSLPAIVIDGKVVSAGKKPSTAEIKEKLTELVK
ncbi:MAG: thioredoxin family protein [Rikenellaceae bacterium]